MLCSLFIGLIEIRSIWLFYSGPRITSLLSFLFEVKRTAVETLTFNLTVRVLLNNEVARRCSRSPPLIT
jgi:hypothetical protein